MAAASAQGASADPVYLDYNATTPLDPAVCRRMSELLVAGAEPSRVLDPANGFGNPSSMHVYGAGAKARLERARAEVASCIGAAEPSEVVFTSGGTESINAAIKGACLAAWRQRQAAADWPNHIVTSAIEHVAVTATVDYLVANFGFRKTVLPVDPVGRVSPHDLEEAITGRTLLVTVMLANNEVGTIQPIAELVSVCRQVNPAILVHTDASQAVGKIPVDVNDLGVDLLSIAGHKLYGPKGIGALYVRGSVQSRLDSVQHGASHEAGRRAGTENVLLAAGLGEACKLAGAKVEEEAEFLAGLRDRLQGLLEATCAKYGFEYRVNGHPDFRLPNTLSFSFVGLTASDLLGRLAPSLSASAGAACHSDGEATISDVLSAMGVPREAALGTLRLSVGRFTTADEVVKASDAITGALLAIKGEASRRERSQSQPGGGTLPPTELEYWEDTYRFKSEGRVLAVLADDREAKEGPQAVEAPRRIVVLDRTIFYPQGGGQPSDTGEMRCAASESVFHVEFVAKDGDIVRHYGFYSDGSPEFVPGATVGLKVDQRKRELHARLHSAGHLIDQAMTQCGINLVATKGCHFPDKGPSVEYKGSIPAEEREALKIALEERVNGLIQQGLHTKVMQMTPQEAAPFCMDGQAPTGHEDEKFRIVLVGGSTGCPCGGTHVHNTREIREIKIRKLASKKGALRVSYEIPE
eukprot:CAMPEP_0202051918 /NCGR_PEP_ID=MMETSP0963-20130614/4921_1 /ASSEMBLY_ACC=CAM_ASM_000494 /TAXON_ID=4773 /ORGANISM="Schizochytrium aggregatum, Strain ATCC28209" /LENGTH=695 /DNA_ID=CAMNT_0048617133 /DNA_START=68 /DNA_END=2155 /DNA_ORIENTATION=+